MTLSEAPQTPGIYAPKLSHRLWRCAPYSAAARRPSPPTPCLQGRHANQICVSVGWRYDGSCGWSEEIRWVDSVQPVQGSHLPIVSHHRMGRSRQSWESKKYSGAFVSCRIHRLAIFIRRERMAAVPPPFFRLACCSLHRCYRIVTDVGLSICFDTTRCSFCFSRPPPLGDG